MAKKKKRPFTNGEALAATGGAGAVVGGFLGTEIMHGKQYFATIEANDELAKAGRYAQDSLSTAKRGKHYIDNAEELANKDFTGQVAIAQADQNLRYGKRLTEQAAQRAADGREALNAGAAAVKKARYFRAGKYASLATAGAGAATVGGAFYMRHRRGKLEKVRRPNRSRTGM